MGRVWCSPDGARWQTSRAAGRRRCEAVRVIPAGSGFVAIGTGQGAQAEKPQVRRAHLDLGRRHRLVGPEVIEGRRAERYRQRRGCAGHRRRARVEQGRRRWATETATHRRSGPRGPVARGRRQRSRQGHRHNGPSVAVSADGVYLVRDYHEGRMRRSTDGRTLRAMLRSPMVNVDGAGAAGSWRPVPDGFTLVDVTRDHLDLARWTRLATRRHPAG